MLVHDQISLIVGLIAYVSLVVPVVDNLSLIISALYHKTSTGVATEGSIDGVGRINLSSRYDISPFLAIDLNTSSLYLSISCFLWTYSNKVMCSNCAV